MSFDLQTISASSAKTATGNTAAIDTSDSRTLNIGVNVTAVSGTTPSCTFSVEWSYDGTNFGAGESPATFAAITATKNTSQTFPVRAPYYRLVWTISGTTPSFTFAAYSYIY